MHFVIDIFYFFWSRLENNEISSFIIEISIALFAIMAPLWGMRKEKEMFVRKWTLRICVYPRENGVVSISNHLNLVTFLRAKKHEHKSCQ